MKKIKNGVHKRIKEVRDKRGLTQEEFANSIGVSTDYISKLERKLRSPSMGLLFIIAAKLKVSEKWLLTGKS